MSLPPSLTVVITAYNEEQILSKTINATLEALTGTIDNYEIIIIDDASRDRSFEVAQEFTKKDVHIHVIKNKKNLNQGGCYKKSIQLAKKDYHCLLPGDNMIELKSLKNLFKSIGNTDMNLISIANKGVRHPIRWVISEGFVRVLNLLFGLNLRYYNGPIVIKTDLLKKIPLSGSFAFAAESIIPLLYKGCTYKVTPLAFTKEKKGPQLKSIQRNFFPVAKAIFTLFWNVRIRRRF